MLHLPAARPRDRRAQLFTILVDIVHDRRDLAFIEKVYYFDELLARIRDIRSSEKVFWRKVLEIYATQPRPSAAAVRQCRIGNAPEDGPRAERATSRRMAPISSSRSTGLQNMPDTGYGMERSTELAVTTITGTC